MWMSNNRIPKFRDVALRGKSQGKVPQRHVLVYSFGDEMYRKVRTTALMPLNKERLRKPYGSDAQLLRECSLVRQSITGMTRRARGIMNAWGHESMVQMLIQNSCSADNRIHITTHNSGWSNFPMEPIQSWLNACTRTCLLKFHFVILSSILGKWIRVCTRIACMMEAIQSL